MNNLNLRESKYFKFDDEQLLNFLEEIKKEALNGVSSDRKIELAMELAEIEIINLDRLGGLEFEITLIIEDIRFLIKR